MQTFETFRKKRRDRRDIRRTIEAIRHLPAHVLRDVGLQHFEDRLIERR